MMREHQHEEKTARHLDRLSDALAGGVVLTTVTDVIGIFAFIGLASCLLLVN